MIRRGAVQTLKIRSIGVAWVHMYVVFVSVLGNGKGNAFANNNNNNKSVVHYYAKAL